MGALVRVLGLGNELLADDGFGIAVAEQLRNLLPPSQVEVVTSSESGLHLLDYVTGVKKLVVIDTIQTGRASLGTLFRIRDEDVRAAGGVAPHGIGLFEALALARKLDYDVPDDVTVFAVEAHDCLTLGGAMHRAVASAIPYVVQEVAGSLALTMRQGAGIS